MNPLKLIQKNLKAWPPKRPKRARVVAETLSDDSIVFNVMVGGETIAWPPLQAEAQAICEKYNKLQVEIEKANEHTPTETDTGKD